MKTTIHGVLAGAYKGANVSARSLLTHASIDGGATSLCKRVKADALCDAEEGARPRARRARLAPPSS